LTSQQQQEQAAEIMNKRFGIEMPVMATGPTARLENHCLCDDHDRSTQPSNQQQQQQDDEQEEVPLFLKELPPQLLESMPKHIQDICHRNPELLRQVLTMNQAPQTTTTSSPLIQETARMPMQSRGHDLYLGQHLQPPAVVVHGLDDPYEDEEDDGERTELLRKRRVDFNVYRATS
jgi:hypothetical protein